jgi:serine/threonine protein kinase/roadblock/LC7 domain-containing protein
MDMLLSVGTKLGSYEILAPIGAGGMGEVYRAKDTKLDREVAIKVLPEALAQDPERLARFHREAKVLASLNHPNIAQIYGVEDRALVMELVTGETLGSILKPGALPVETVLDYARQIAEALEAAHEKGIVHRDLKPSNVIVTPAGLVKVLDFGLAKMVDGPSGADDPEDSPTVTLSPTRVGIILGTAAYMSPEQARGDIADKRADIWTFGVVLYEMLTAKRAFSGESISDILAGVLRAEPDWSALPTATPLRIRVLLRRCLERDRTKRLQAIGEARIAIDAPEPDAMPPSGSARPWHWGLWAVAALTTAVAVTAAIGWWRASHSDPPRPLMHLDVELGPEATLARITDGPLLALSPDGTTLALIVRDPAGETRLATRRVDQSQITPLAGTEGAIGPFFSPDGQWIAFYADRQMKKIAAGGGAAVTLCDATAHMTGSWGDDGNIVAALGWGTSLSQIPSAGGAPTLVTSLKLEKGELRHSWPEVLPGSRAILFTTEFAGRSTDEADIEVVSLETGKRTLLHHGGFFGRYLPSGHLVWVFHNVLYAASFDLDHLTLTGQPQPVLEDVNNRRNDGGQFAFSQTGSFAYVSVKGELQRSIFWLDRTGNTQPLHAAPGLYGAPRFSPDGKRLAFSASDGQSHEDIWVRDLERDTASRVTLLPGRNQSPVWTPDGKNLIFSSSNPASPGIYLIRADGSLVAQRLTEAKTEQGQPSISPDGKRLAIAQTSASGGVEIWSAMLEDDAGRGGVRLGRTEPFLQTPFTTILPAFSPDGRFLAYTSSVPGKKGLWVVPFPGPGGGWLVSARGDCAVWPRGTSGAGGEVFFQDMDSQSIMVASYTAAGDALVFGKPHIWSPHRVPDLGSPPMRPFDVSPDGKRVAVVLNADGTADPKPITHLTLLVNFTDDLRRRAPAGK